MQARSPACTSHVEIGSVAPLPAPYLAQFLATQLLSSDPAQALLDLAQYAPGSSAPLRQAIESYQGSVSTSPAGHLGLQESLEHIQAHFPIDKQLPDMTSWPSIERPFVELTPEELQYLFTGFTCEDDNNMRPSIDPLVNSLENYTTATEFDIDNLILGVHLGVFRRGVLWYPSQIPMGVTSMHMKSIPVQYYDSHGHLHNNHVPIWATILNHHGHIV